jgi:hypothetical protein
MRQLKTTVGVLSVAALFLPGALEAASCTAEARYVKGEAQDAIGFKQALTFAVAADKAGHGLINYTMNFTDKAGASLTEAGNESYKFNPAAATASSGGGGAATGGATTVSHDLYLSLKGFTVVGVTVNDVSCYKESKGKCTATASYVDSGPGSAKGKAKINFNLNSADCAGACSGYVKYSLTWKDSAGVEKTQSAIHDYKVTGSGGGGGGKPEVQVVDNTNLSPKCSKANPCTLGSVTVDKVSCFAD